MVSKKRIECEDQIVLMAYKRGRDLNKYVTSSSRFTGCQHLSDTNLQNCKLPKVVEKYHKKPALSSNNRHIWG